MTVVVGNRNKRKSESKDDDDDDKRKKKRSSSRSSSRQKRKKTKQSSSRSSSRQKRKKTKQSSSRSSSSRQKRKKTKQSTGTNDTTESMLQKLRITAEITPPKSLVIIWILMAAELGFDLITTGIAFFSSMAGKTECCGSNASMGPFPMATTVPFFLLIVAEITFLGRAILLTLWPRTYETSRIATHAGTDDDEVGFEITVPKNKTKPKRDDNVQELYNNEIPEFINGRNRNSKKSRGGCFCSCLKCFCSCFLRWNAKMVLCILNLLTLLNPFFGCLIAWILLYQSDKTESFIVLGIESLSIILHFISVRMEGGLRTWYSKLLHSVAILPFLVTVTLVLVYIREGGVCYSVEKEMFSFSGCEICPDTLLPPDINGMCFESTSDGGGGNYTSSSVYSLAGSGGFLQDVQDLGNINGIKDIQNNFANLIDRGADQDSYCSPDTNFCFYKF